MERISQNEVLERPSEAFTGMRVAWGGVFGGVLIGFGILLLLSALGLAVGISAVDPAQSDGESIGTGTGLWAAVALLIALFIGGWASTRLSMLWDTTTALFEGALVWVLSLTLILYLATSGIQLVAGGASQLLGGAFQGVASAVGGMDVTSLSSGSVDEILGRLRDPQTADRLAVAIGAQRDEVASTLRDTADRVDQARNDPTAAIAAARDGLKPLAERAQQRLTNAAARAQPGASRGAWFSFAALVLSLCAAIGGAAVGRRNAAQRARTRTRYEHGAAVRSTGTA